MVQIEIPDRKIQRFNLVEVQRRTRRGTDTAQQLKSWVGLSEPAHVTLGPDDIQDDKELSLFLKNSQQDQYAFHYVKFGCSFVPRDGEIFDRAAIMVELKRSDGIKEKLPIGWSMQPLIQYDNVEVTSGAKLGGTFKLLSSEIKSNEKRDQKEIYLRAYREGESNPFWEFTPTPQFKIDGSYRLHMIIRTYAFAETKGKVELSAIVRRKRFLIIPTEEELQKRPVNEFELPAAV